MASGEYDAYKREEFQRDAPEGEQSILLETFVGVSDFCLQHTNANCFLIEKDIRSSKVDAINELVDLKFLHHISSRVTARDKASKLYDGYMLDLSQYVGERAKRGFEIIEFWNTDNKDALRRAGLIYHERDERGA